MGRPVNFEAWEKPQAFLFVNNEPMNFQLSEEQLAVQQAARDFAITELLPGVIERDNEAKFPTNQIKKMGELGFMGMMVDPKYNGGGMDTISYVLAMEEISKIDASASVCMSVNNSLVCWGLESFGTEEQKEKYLKPLALGQKIGAFCLSEPEAGSDATSQRTTAEDKGDYYLLNGTKNWITNGNSASIYIVIAQTDVEKRHKGINALIVEKGMKGFSAPEIHGKWSLRASITGELVFEDVRVPKENILPGVEGLKGPLSCLSKARYGIAWGAIGAALDCYDSALRYSTEREQFGRPIGQFQLTQKKLAEMITEITKAQLLAWRLGTLANVGKATPAQISMAKRNNVAMALDIAREARQIHGGMGITSEYPTMRHMMNLESVITYEGTHDIHLLITGMDVTGLNAFK